MSHPQISPELKQEILEAEAVYKITPIHMRLGYEYVMPMSLDLNKSFHASEKRFFGVVRNLMRVKGYCWASNQYLAELFDVNKRTICRWIKKLCTHQFLKREVFFDGLRKFRRLWLHDEFVKLKKPISRDMDVASVATCPSKPHVATLATCPSKPHGATIIRSSNLHNTHTHEERDTPPSTPAQVKLTYEEMGYLVHEFGKDIVNATILRMNTYCAEQRPRGYKYWYNQLRDWMLRDRHKFQRKPKALSTGYPAKQLTPAPKGSSNEAPEFRFQDFWKDCIDEKDSKIVKSMDAHEREAYERYKQKKLQSLQGKG